MAYNPYGGSCPPPSLQRRSRRPKAHLLTENSSRKPLRTSSDLQCLSWLKWRAWHGPSARSRFVHHHPSLSYLVAMQLTTSTQALHQACPLPLEWHLLQVSSKPILLIDQVDCPPPSSLRRTSPTSTSTLPSSALVPPVYHKSLHLAQARAGEKVMLHLRQVEGGPA